MTQPAIIPTSMIEVDQIGLFAPASLGAPAPVVKRSMTEKVADALAAIKAQVLAGRTPVCAYSGGKDSSLMLSLTFTALSELREAGHQIPTLHVVHSDTLIENPVVAAYNKRQIKQIRRYSEESGIAARVWVASPSLSNDYLVSIIGGRTIASVGNNTKCQQMMKAAPLTRIKKSVRIAVAEEMGVKPKKAQLVSLIGTRFDESAQRGRMMEKRGESASVAVEAMAGSGELVLSPIADFSTFDVFEYIGNVRSGKIKTYDSFDELVEVYRDMNGGDCMVTAYMAGKEQARSPCSARTGCWGCLRVSRDVSAENMVASEDGKFDWMKPLNDFRNYLMRRHFDPSARCWLSRSVSEDGKIVIAPNAYSPQFTLELLQMALTIQVREIQASRKLGIAPRFKLLTLKQVLAIDVLWGRYAYQQPFTALRTYLAIYQEGKRYPIPALDTVPEFKDKDVSFRAEVPFADDEYQGVFSGFRNIEWAAADAEDLVETSSGALLTDANTGTEFDIDQEGLELFIEFEMEHALNRISLNDAPAAVVHYLVGLGTVQLAKGGHSEWDRMLRMSNQIHRLGLLPVLNDPQALVEKLSGKQATGQGSLF